ncbi:hypothetical protein MVEN_00688400 [Mycena venus]|uniref:Malate dehydrogenase n=1 Tax=Mycena venus TaxID=2733690 RepID=A0A8H6YEG1_9AGAR|nr:hypothetical protein MVEN_00688400 [Mycena venus]
MISFQLIAFIFAFVAPLVSAEPPLFVCKDESCDTSKAVMDLPPSQTALVAPAIAPLFVLLGVGVQNYTCSGTTFASIGAVASFFDISCLAGTSKFDTIQNTTFKVWGRVPSSVPSTAIGALVGAPYLDGVFPLLRHPSSGTSISPKWDFTSTGKFAGNSTAFVIGVKVGDILASTNPAADIDWLRLARVEGDLASHVFRVDTVGGQPPTSCVSGSPPISVKYTSKYYLF